MPKTLRVRTRSGWDTKDPADTIDNKLTAGDVDANFLEVEDGMAPIGSLELELATTTPRPGWSAVPSAFASVSGTPDVIGTYGTPDRCHWSPDGTLLAVAVTSYGFVVFNTVDWSVAHDSGVIGSGYHVHFSPDSSMIAVAYGNTVSVYSTSSWAVLHTYTSSWNIWTAKFSPDQNYLGVLTSYNDGVIFYNVGTWTKVAVNFTRDSLTPYYRHGSWTADSANFAVMLAGVDYGVPYLQYVDVATWSLTDFPDQPGSNGNDMVTSPDGTRIFAANTDFNEGYVYDNSFQLVQTLQALADPADGTTCGDYSPDGSELAVGLESAPFLQLIDTSDYSLQAAQPGSLPGEAKDVSFNPTGEFLAAFHSGGTGLTVVDLRVRGGVTVPPAGFEWRIKDTYSGV